MAEARNFYRVWQEALRHGVIPDPQLSVDICGFWRIQAAKTKPDAPVAIWPVGERQVLKVGRREVVAENSQIWGEFIGGNWPHCTPVSKKEYDAAMTDGIWPSDGKPSRTLTIEEKAGVVEGQKPAEGDNAPPPEELIGDKIKDLAEIIGKTPAPKTQAEADLLDDRNARLDALITSAEVKRLEENKPIREAKEAVDNKWKAIMAPGVQVLPAAKARVKDFLRALKVEADRKAKEENDARIVEAKERAAAIAASQNLSPEEERDLTDMAGKVAAAQPVEVIKPKVGGTFTRATTLKKKRMAKIVDMHKLVDHYLATNDPDFTVYMQSRAQAAVRAKATLPGVEVEEIDV